MWDALGKITHERTPIVLFGTEPFSSRLRSSNLPIFRYDWIWVKDTHSNFLNARRQPCKRHELISVFYRKQALYNPQHWKGEKNHTIGKALGRVEKREIYSGKYAILNNDFGNDKMPISILYYNRVRNNVFPTQKPVPLLEYLIRTYTHEGANVLDFTMGSGSTGIACINTGRNFTGIEKDPAIFDLASGRIDDHLQNNKKK